MSYSIINADLTKHREDILGLWDRNFQKVPKARYPWIYENNPSGLPVCFLLRQDESGSIVGAISLFPRTAFVHGRQVDAYICGDFLVDKNHRSLGPAISLLKAAINKCEQEKTTIVLGFPNEKSEPVTIRAGFEVLGNVIEMTKILKTKSYIHKYIRASLLSQLVSSTLDMLLFFRYEKLLCKKYNKYSFELTESFDERFTSLHSNTINYFSLKGEVNNRYLKWRFIDSPYNKCRIFELVSRESSNLLGYILFQLNNNRIQISDLAFNTREISLTVLINVFSRFQRLMGAESAALRIAGSSSVIDELKKCGFMVRSSQMKTIIYASVRNRAIVSEIKNGNWFLTSGDNDI